MFYSHTFLARKSPLGTVWMAAHLQHKLRKSHIAVTDISTSVDYIMFPEVPIALRLSGHLLLGVVRIYSKKVDYLYHDCTDILTRIRTAFASIQEVNLSEDASRAPFHTITLPETFELDNLDLDDELYFEGILDNHLKTHEEITIRDQIPVEGDPYVAFFINEDIRMDISPPAEIPEMGIRPMEEDVPSVRTHSGVGVSDPGPTNHADESNQKHSEDQVHQDLPEIEVRRDAVHNLGLENLPDWPDLGNDTIEQHRSFETMNQKENLSPIMEDMSVSGRQSMPFELHPDPPAIVASAESLENFDSHVSLGHVSPEMGIQPTPPVEKKKAKSRKRKQLFDASVVLTNEFIKEGLKDASKLVRKRKKFPCSALDVWKFNNRSRMEHVFLESSISGVCTNLQNMFKKEFISSKVYTIPVEDALPEPRGARSPASMPPDMEIERLRFYEGHVDGNFLSEVMPSSSGRDEFTPFPSSNIGLEPQTEVLPTFETEAWPTLERTASTEPVGFEMETPVTCLGEQLGIEDTGLSDIPELLNSAEAEDLSFLEVENTPAGREETEEVDTLSVRTRAVAQYLKKQSPATEISKDQSRNLSLNKILEGKTRKQCARMFFETLVLKSYGLIDVQQEEAYGDITLSLTSTLSKAKF